MKKLVIPIKDLGYFLLLLDLALTNDGPEQLEFDFESESEEDPDENNFNEYLLYGKV